MTLLRVPFLAQADARRVVLAHLGRRRRARLARILVDPKPNSTLKFSHPLGRLRSLHLSMLLLHELVGERLLPLDLLHLRKGQSFSDSMHRLLRDGLGELSRHLLLALLFAQLGVLDDVGHLQTRPTGRRRRLDQRAEGARSFCWRGGRPLPLLRGN